MEPIPVVYTGEPYHFEKFKDRKRFIDITHDGLGRLCTMYYDPKTKRYELEPLLNQF